MNSSILGMASVFCLPQLGSTTWFFCFLRCCQSPGLQHTLWPSVVCGEMVSLSAVTINCIQGALPSGSLLAAHHSFAFAASHTASRDNFIADALSHFDFQGFHCLATHTAPVATSVLQSLLAQLPMTWTQIIQWSCTLHSAVYGSAKHQYLAFCGQDTPSNLCHLFLTAREQTVMHFCAYLADCLHHSFY